MFCMKSMKCFSILGFLPRVRFKEVNLETACIRLFGSLSLGVQKCRGATQLLESPWGEGLARLTEKEEVKA